MRVRWIDNAKGIAMICVILGHVNGGTYGKVDLSFVHAIHLSVFFLLTGYTLKSQKITKEYVNNKFRRLMKPYFYTCIAITLMDVFNCMFIAKEQKIFTIAYIIGKDIIRSFFASGLITNFAGIEIGTRIGAIWFLPAMFFAVLIVQWILNHFEEEWKQWVVILLVALVGYISSTYIWLPFSIQAGMTASAFILTGYYIKKYLVLEKLKGIHYFIFLVFFAFGVWKEYDHFYIVANLYPDLLITFCVSLSGSFLLLKLAKCAEKSRLLNFVGRQSIYFLCAHLFALETMGWYFNYIINAVDIVGDIPYMWVSFVLNLLFSSAVAFVIYFIKGFKKKKFLEGDEDLGGVDVNSINIMKGILIVSIVAGNLISDSILRTIIYSCHMIAFVFLSGYSYQKKGKTEVIQLLKNFFILYSSFCLIHLLLSLKEINSTYLGQYVKSYIFAISSSKNLFVDISAIGPVWFINMLFAVKVIYIFIDYFIHNNWTKFFIIMMLSLIGVQLGDNGYWLPWSMDCALFCLSFYHIGILCRQLNVLNYIYTHSAFYFSFSIVWAYMIYISNMDLTVRRYSPYGIVILGALCGTFLLHICSKYIAKNMPIIGGMIKKIGENAIYVLIVHAMFGEYITIWLARYFNPENIGHLSINIIFQVYLGIVVGVILQHIIRETYFSNNY